MDKEKLIKQLFIGKVAEIIGTEKTAKLLNEATVTIYEMFKSRKGISCNSVCSCGNVHSSFEIETNYCWYCLKTIK